MRGRGAHPLQTAYLVVLGLTLGALSVMKLGSTSSTSSSGSGWVGVARWLGIFGSLAGVGTVLTAALMGGETVTMLQLDAGDPTPPYERIRCRLAFLVASGELAERQRLPAVRQVASDLRVAPGSVSRIFKEFAVTGYVETHRAVGTRALARTNSPQVSSLAELAPS